MTCHFLPLTRVRDSSSDLTVSDHSLTICSTAFTTQCFTSPTAVGAIQLKNKHKNRGAAAGWRQPNRRISPRKPQHVTHAFMPAAWRSILQPR